MDPDMVSNILLNLPFKSLCRFKSVSKSFLALITDPRFVRMHLARESKPERVLILSDTRSLESALHIVNPETIDDDNAQVISRKLDLPFEHQTPSRFSIYGSSNGLVCLSVKNLHRDDHGAFFLLINPFTRDYKRIPDTPISHAFRIRSGIHCYDYDTKALYGFGYAEPLDDFKVVKFCECRKLIYIFSLESNSWKTVPHDFPYCHRDYGQGVSLKGAVHWVFADDQEHLIGAFDLVEEKFKTLPLPDEVKNNCKCRIGVSGRIGGCLMLCQRGESGVEHFWVMKEYGVGESWVRIFTDDKCRCLRPLCYLNKGAVMVNASDYWPLIVYSPRDDRFKYIDVVQDGAGTWSLVDSVDVYSESLVSLTQ